MTKQIKLQYKYRSLAWGKQKIVPELKLSGVWLEKLGFKAGSIVDVTTREKEIVVKLNEQQDGN